MIRRPPRCTRPDTLFPYTTLCLSRNLRRRIILAARLDPRIAVGALGDGIGDEFHVLLGHGIVEAAADQARSEEHTSELQSLMRISYADFCLTTHTYKDRLLPY